MKTIIRLSILVFFLIYFQGTGFPGQKITIVYTNSLNGNIDFCHCKTDPKGGLVKRSTEIKKIRNQYKNILLFETGDFFTFEEDPLLAKYLVQAYKHINYDAMTPGDQEFSIGSDSFLKYKNTLPFICNNLLIKSGGWKRIFKRYKVIKINNIKIGIIGTISADSFKYHPKKLLERSILKVTDQAAEIRNDIKELKGQGVNFIILLSHSGFDKDSEIQKQFKDIDVIVGGHSQTLIKKPSKKNSSVIVQAGANGTHIGILEITTDGSIIESYKNSFRMPDEHQPADDKFIRKLINSYKSEVQKELKKMRLK